MNKYSKMSNKEIREMVTESFGEEFLKEYDGISQELSSESERASVLVGAAWLDQHLYEFIRSVLPDDEKLKKVLLSTIRHFGSRIDVAHRLGILGDNEKELIIIAKDIRNNFAHKTFVSFKDKNVAKLVDQLESFASVFYFPMKEEANDKQSMYVGVVSYFVASFFVRTRSAMKVEDLDARLDMLRFMATESDKDY